jgi:transcriptional regulator with XRE-family HTH domain
VRETEDGSSVGDASNDRSGVTFGHLIVDLRLDRGLSQEDLADRSGMSVRAIRYLECGRVLRPRRRSVSLLADALALTEAERMAFTNVASHLVRRPSGHMQWAAAPVVPGQLPPDISDFTGREAALERLHARITSREQRSTSVVITAVHGPAGVGKTTLAVHWAHQVRTLFPNGQLYVNLHGARAPDSADVLSSFMRALGVDGRCVPEDADERASLYRSLLADRRMLVLLDNAVNASQVRPLLPAGAGNVVLITSRSRLAGLAAAEVVDLDVLPPGQAVELLGKIAGRDRIVRDPAAAAKLSALCEYLPLALRIVGARLAAKPHWPLQRLAGRIAVDDRRLDELTLGDLAVRASIGLSYRSLGEMERRAFRLLGLLDSADFAPWMLAALLGVPEAQAEDIAERLRDAELLAMAGADVTGQPRFRFHDLIRLYSRERLAAEDGLAPGNLPPVSSRTARSRDEDSLSTVRIRVRELAPDKGVKRGRGQPATQQEQPTGQCSHGIVRAGPTAGCGARDHAGHGISGNREPPGDIVWGTCICPRMPAG